MRHEAIAMSNSVVHAAGGWFERMRSNQPPAAYAASPGDTITGQSGWHFHWSVTVGSKLAGRDQIVMQLW